MGRVDGKVAVVVGIGAIGRASCLTLAREGCAVVAVDLHEQPAQQAAEEIRAGGGRAVACQADASNEAGAARMVAVALEEFGRLDILHNNATLRDGRIAGRDRLITEMDAEVWDAVVGNNARGYMLGVKHAVPAMIRSGGGSIINTSSGASLAGNIGLTAYAASKAAINSLTRYAATQFDKQGVRCNALVLGLIDTPSSRGVASARYFERQLEHVLTPYIGVPQDAADVVLFLASDESRYITGQMIHADGGAYVHHPVLRLRGAASAAE